MPGPPIVSGVFGTSGASGTVGTFGITSTVSASSSGFAEVACLFAVEGRLAENEIDRKNIATH